MAREKIIGIYLITSPTGKVYVGQSRDILFRFDVYKKLRYPKSQPKLYASLIKHTPENHIFTIIELCSEEKLNELERFYIRKHDSFDTPHGMNLKDGENKGCKLSEETKRKISIGNMGNKKKLGIPVSPETRRKISVGNLGNKKRLGNVVTLETREKIRKSMVGVKHSPQRVANMIAAAARIPSKRRKPVNQYSKDGELIKMWNSIMDIQRALGFDGSAISKACRGIFKLMYNYKWKYA